MGNKNPMSWPTTQAFTVSSSSTTYSTSSSCTANSATTNHEVYSHIVFSLLAIPAVAASALQESMKRNTWNQWDEHTWKQFETNTAAEKQSSLHPSNPNSHDATSIAILPTSYIWLGHADKPKAAVATVWTWQGHIQVFKQKQPLMAFRLQKLRVG